MFAGLCARPWRAGGHSLLFTMVTTACFVRTGWERIRKGSSERFAISTAEESESGLQPPGSPENWRCIALDKLSGVKLLDGAWQTAPNHSRPASCVVEADVDAEDYPERDPQQGH
jgi:hypothetical protein